MTNKTLTDVFYQGSQEGIPPHWCVQYLKEGDSFVSYEIFGHDDKEGMMIYLQKEFPTTYEDFI